MNNLLKVVNEYLEVNKTIPGNSDYWREKFQSAFDADKLSSQLELQVMQNADIGLDLCLPERIGWTEFTKDNIVFHYSTKDEYENCTNTKTTGIKLSVSA